MIYREYRSGVRRSGAPNMLHVDSIYGRMGFISVYGFDKETKDEIIENNGTYGLMGKDLYSDLLYIDVDDNDLLSEQIVHTLQTRGVSFDLYHTGGRGWHFHILTKPMKGPNVAYEHKTWVSNMFPGCDISIYKTSGLIRLPGTYHSKNPGKRKEIRSRFDGEPLEIDISQMVSTPIDWGEELSHETEQVLDTLMMKSVVGGNRNNDIYIRAMLFNKLNEPLEEAVKVISKFNSYLVRPPLEDQELFNIIRSAYRS